MKKVIILWVFVLSYSIPSLAQSPKSFSYQGIAVDSAGYILSNKPITLRFSLYSDSIGTDLRFQEEVSAQTDKWGQFAVNIGSGTVLKGSMLNVVWETGNIFLKVEMDVNKTGKYVSAAYAKLLSVPYALYASDAKVKYIDINPTISKNSILIGDSTGLNAGVNNLVIGHRSFSSSINGLGNVIIGMNAVTKGNNISNNVLIGNNAASYLDSGSNNVFIGNDVAGNSTYKKLSNKLIIQNDSSAVPLVFGEFDAKKLTINGDLKVTGNLDANVTISSDAYENTRGGSGALNNPKPQTTTANTAFGINALRNNVGLSNTAIGAQSMVANYNGMDNTAVGWKSLFSNSTGSENTAVGVNTLGSNLTGNFNSAFGKHAATWNKTGTRNTALGYGALFTNYNGSSNTAVGMVALQNDTASYNTAVGDWALGATVSGSGNTAIGYLAGSALEAGNNNIFIGKNSGNNAAFKSISNKLIIQNDNSSTPLVFGEFDLKKVTINGDLLLKGSFITGNESSNISIGSGSLKSNKIGNNNIALGTNALSSNDEGAHNIAIGAYALEKSTVATAGSLGGRGFQNIAIGSWSLQNAASNANVSIGSEAMQSVTTGTQNTALGEHAMRAVVTGNANVSIGYMSMIYAGSDVSNAIMIGRSAGESIKSGTNVGIGSYSLSSTTTGNANIGIGYVSLFANTTGSGNTAIGDNALVSNTTGAANNGVGQNVLKTNSIGSSNNGFGDEALLMSTGSNLTAFGAKAGKANTTGSNNTFIGSLADADNGTYSNAAAIGYGAIVKSSNTMSFGKNVNKWVFGIGTTSNSGYALEVGNTTSNGNGAYLTNGGVWTNASSRKFKENFEEINDEEILEKLRALAITKWNYKGTDEQHIGPVAEDFKAVFHLGVNGDDQHISTIDAAGVALKAIQALEKKIKEKEDKIAELESRLKKLETLLLK